MIKILIVVPAYNEEDCLPEVLKSLRDYDVLVVNDGSTDSTPEVCLRFPCRVLHLAWNIGVGGAVQAGFRYAAANGYDVVIQFDGDGQHDGSYIPAMVSELERADMVIASRFLEYEGYQSAIIRRMGIRYLQGLMFLVTGRRITDPTSGFRAYSRRCFEYFAQSFPRDYPEPEALIIAHRHRLIVSEIPTIMCERQAGTSTLQGWKVVYFMARVTLMVALRATLWR